MATTEETGENNNFLSELKNVLQRFGHLDSGCVTSSQDEGSTTGTSASSGSDRKLSAPSSSPPHSEVRLRKWPPPVFVENGDSHHLSPEITHQTHFHPRPPLTPLASFRRIKSPRDVTDDDEYPPKTPPKTVFQQLPPLSPIRKVGSVQSTSMESVLVAELHSVDTRGRGVLDGGDGRGSRPRSMTLSSPGSGALKPAVSGSGATGGLVGQSDLYNELNTVLRRRAQQGQPSQKLLDIEKMKTGKTTVYYGRGRQISSSDEGFSPSPTRGRAATVDGPRPNINVNMASGGYAIGKAQSSAGTGAGVSPRIREKAAQIQAQQCAVVNPRPPTPPPLPPSGSVPIMKPLSPPTKRTTTAPSTHHGSKLSLPATVRAPSKGHKKDCVEKLLLPAIHIEDEPVLSEAAVKSEPMSPSSPQSSQTPRPSTPFGLRAIMDKFDDHSTKRLNGNGELESFERLHGSKEVCGEHPGTQQQEHPGTQQQDHPGTQQQDHPGTQQQEAVERDREEMAAIVTDPYNCPTLPIRAAARQQRSVAPPDLASVIGYQEGSPSQDTPPKQASDCPSDSTEATTTKSCGSGAPLLARPLQFPVPEDIRSYRDLTDASFSASDYDLPTSPEARRCHSSDDSATSTEFGGVSGYRRPGRRHAPKALSWHSLMFVTGDDRWIEHYTVPADGEDTSGSGSRDTSGSSSQRCQSYGNLLTASRSDKKFRSSGLPSSRQPQRRRWGRGMDAPLSKVYATFPPPRWMRGGGGGSGKDDDLLTALMITHSGERIPSDGEYGPGANRLESQTTSGAILRPNLTVPLPTSFHMHANNVSNNLMGSPVMETPLPQALPEISSPEPDYDLTETDEECHRVTDSDDHVSCHVCMSLADETSVDGLAETEDEGDEGLGEADPLLETLMEVATDGEADADVETEDSTDLDVSSCRHRIPAMTTEHPANSATGDTSHRSYHTRAGEAHLAPTKDAQLWPGRGIKPRLEDDSDSSAYRARQWCHQAAEVCPRSPLCQPPLVSDTYSSDDTRQVATGTGSTGISTRNGNKSSPAAGPLVAGGMRVDRSYSIANSIQSMCTYILDTYDHSSDADTESLYQDYDAYEKALIQYVRTEDLSNMNADIRSLYWQQLDAKSLRALRLQPRRVLHKFICCFMCDRPLRIRSRRPASSTAAGSLKQGEGNRRSNKGTKGCPLTQKIEDDSSSVTVYGDGLHKGEAGKPSSFIVKTRPDARGDLWVQVDGPNSIAKCNIEAQGPGMYKVTYVPVEHGTYIIQIKLNGKPVIGCPYRPVIGRSGDASKVMLLSGGAVPAVDAGGALILRVNQSKRIEFDTSQAGSGNLTAKVTGPNSMTIPTEVTYGNGKHIVTFTPIVEGHYNLFVHWEDTNIPNSPFYGVASSGVVVNHEKVVLTGRGLKEARVREDAEFMVDGRSAGQGLPEVSLQGVKSNIEVTTLPIGGNMFRCVYRPTIPGAYLLYIKWSDRQVRGSPFKVTVNSSSDASSVMCTGEGLKLGVMGQEIKSIIDTRRAGPGELTAHCQGPRREAYCSLYNNHDGTFTLTIKPQDSGRHILTIKYDDEHVPGSPFALRISGAPDASKVVVKGPGVEHGLLALYKSHFIVETRGAGAGQLTVRVRGPKGAFRVEMQRESSKDRTIMCRYDPAEVGDYVVHIKWSGEHVPGSPFNVHIADTQDELERYVSDGYMNSMQSSRTMESRAHNMDF